MATELHHLSDYNEDLVPDASNMCFGIVVAEWNPEITNALLTGCVATLEKHGALPENIHVKSVPGSFELIYGAHQMSATMPSSFWEASFVARLPTSTISARG